MSAIYSTKATALAGRNGNVASNDGLLELTLGYPKELGGDGKATNPEQLFAAGYAACFSNAVLFVAREAKLKLTQAPVTAEVGMSQNDQGAFSLSVSLEASLDLPQEEAIKLVQTAHQTCPYSNAVKGNIDVALSVNGQAI